MLDLHLGHRLDDVFARFPDRPATRERLDGEWVVQTYAELDAAVEQAARGLVTLGLEPGDRVAIFSHNRPAWTVADLACIRAGLISVPLYPSSTPDQVRHILADCDARGMIAEGEVELAKIAEVRDQLPNLAHIVTFDDVDDATAIRFADLDGPDDGELEHRRLLASPDDVATIIYTSGTTGDPKGVVLQHKAFVTEIEALEGAFDITPEDHSLCFLPLSHAFERGWTYCVLLHGCMNTYVTDPSQIAAMLAEVRPTLFISVPRLYEKVQAAVVETVSSSPSKKRIYDWAMRVGGRVQRANRKGKVASVFWRWQLPLADRLVFRKIRDAIGGPKTALAAGGAPLRQDVEEFFSSAGVLVCQGYGMTEAAPLISFNAPRDFKFGTAGRVMPGGEIKIGAESEILFRSGSLMQGYWNNPEETAQAIDADGWLHTGDAGYVDVDGFVVITDRLKDLLVTSGGKNVAPQPIEGMLKADPLFEQAILLGDNRPFLTLLVRPNLPRLEEIAKNLQIQWNNFEELLADSRIHQEFQRRVRELTSKLPKHEQIKDLRLLLEEFTTDNGLLTPTLKVKRKEVEERFHDVIEDMYARLADLRKRGSSQI